MPTLCARGADGLLAGDHQNAAADMLSEVYLSGFNKMPNPDLRDFDELGNAEYWGLLAPDDPDGSYVFLRRVRKVVTNGQGQRVFVRDEDSAHRQQGGKHGLDEDFHFQRTGLEPGSPLPPAGKRARIAPPADAPRTRVLALGGPEGFAAGKWFLGKCWIVGDQPKTSEGFTGGSEPVEVDLLQGQRIKVYVDEAPPEGATGIGWTLGRTKDAMYVVERTDTRNATPPFVVLGGPFTKSRRRKVTRDSPNRTTAPREGVKTKIVDARRGTEAFQTELSYQLRTSQGWEPPAQFRPVTVEKASGQALAFKPKGMGPAVKEWRPLFVAADGNVWTISNSAGRGSGLARRQWAHLHTIQTSPELDERGRLAGGWFGPGKPRRMSEEDLAFVGVEGPDSAVANFEILGEERMPPGDYAARACYGVEDEKSGPSPPSRVVRLRESPAGSGTSDQYLKVSLPRLQKIDNERYSDEDSDGLDLDWTDAKPPGTTVVAGGGVLTINATGQPDDVAVRVQREPVPVRPDRVHTFRADADCDRHASGAQSLRVRYHREEADGTFALLGSDPLFRVSSAGEDGTMVRVGPRSKRADLWWPDGTTHISLAFHVLPGVSDGGGANADLRVRWRHLAMFTGRGAARKRWPLGLGLTNPADLDEKRAPGAEDPEDPYPEGAYCRIVEDPTDGPAIKAPHAPLLSHGFENGQITVSGLSHPASTGGVTVGVGQEGALRGDMGLTIERAAGQAGSGRGIVRWDGCSGRARFAWSGLWGLRVPWGAGSGVLTRCRDAAANSGAGRSIVEVRRDGENLVVDAANGAGSVTQTINRHALKGSNWKIEVECAGVGTASGRVTVRLRRTSGGKSLSLAEILSLDLSGLSASFCDAGVVSSPANERFVVAFDDFRATDASAADLDPLPGNYAEYWAPEGTPPGRDRFMVGMRVPLLPDTDYVFSAYVGAENLEARAEVLPSVVKNSAGRVVRNNGPLAGMIGDEEWERPHLGFRTPAATEDSSGFFLDFPGNLVGGGLLRGGWLQLDQDRTGAEGPRPFDNTNSQEGFVTVTFDTSIPGGDPLDGMLEADTRLVSAAAVVDHEEDGDGLPLTSHALEFAAAATRAGIEDPAAAWLPTLEEVRRPGTRFVGVRARLYSLDPTRSPKLRAVRLDIERYEGVLCDAEGEEYPSFCLIRNFGVPQPRRRIVAHEYADGEEGFDDLTIGAPPRYVTLDLECYRESAVRRISHDQGRGDGTFVAEVMGRRYLIRFLGAVFATNRAVSWDAAGQSPLGESPLGGAPEGHALHQATGLQARVLEEYEIG